MSQLQKEVTTLKVHLKAARKRLKVIYTDSIYRGTCIMNFVQYIICLMYYIFIVFLYVALFPCFSF